MPKSEFPPDDGLGVDDFPPGYGGGGAEHAWTDRDAGEPRSPQPPKQPLISAKPFVWRDPSTFPRRRWLYGYHLIRKFLSCTVAPGGVGKSSLLLVEVIAMAAGRNLVGTMPTEGQTRVWYWNGEDPIEEIERRVVAICLHYKIDPAVLDGFLFLNSGRDTSLILAYEERGNLTIAVPVVKSLTAEILAKEIDVLVIDPFIKAHRVVENDNTKIDAVATEIARIADVANIGIDLVHHVRKTGANEVTVEDGRGAVALLSACRSARVLNVMTKTEAESAGVKEARRYFRTNNGKANLAPPADRSDWYFMTSVPLGNGSGGLIDDGGDHVGVVTKWEWPNPLDAVKGTADLRAIQSKIASSKWRENVQAKDWAGKAIAEVLHLDVADKAAKSKISGLLKIWIANGALVKVTGLDEHREEKLFIEVGTWATD